MRIEGQQFEGVKDQIEIDLWGLNRTCQIAAHLRDLAPSMSRQEPEIYQEYLQQKQALEERHITEVQNDLRQLTAAYGQHASPREAVTFFKTRLFEPILAACINARDNGDIDLVNALGRHFSPGSFIPWGMSGSSFCGSAMVGVSTEVEGSRIVSSLRGAEYLLYENEPITKPANHASAYASM